MKLGDVALAGAVLLLSAGSALADTEFTSQSDFNAAVAGATTYSIPMPAGGVSQNVGSSYTIGPATFNAGDVTLYNDGFYGNGQTYLAAFGNGVNVSLTGTTAVGFNVGLFQGGGPVTVLIDGTPFDVIGVPGAPDSTFIGFVSDSPITSVSFLPQTEDSEFDVLNFETGSSTPAPTPEPSSLALLGSALLGGAATLRKRLGRS